jgi:hypothetical protein
LTIKQKTSTPSTTEIIAGVDKQRQRNPNGRGPGRRFEKGNVLWLEAWVSRGMGMLWDRMAKVVDPHPVRGTLLSIGSPRYAHEDFGTVYAALVTRKRFGG